MLRIVKYILKKKGVLCVMCEDAVATESQQVCKDCAQELHEAEMYYYNQEMLEMMR